MSEIKIFEKIKRKKRKERETEVEKVRDKKSEVEDNVRNVWQMCFSKLQFPAFHAKGHSFLICNCNNRWVRMFTLKIQGRNSQNFLWKFLLFFIILGLNIWRL
jgi:hypothetical protein